MKTKNKDWRGLPITRKQIDLMQERGIAFDCAMTRGESSDAISEDLEDSPHIFSEEAVQG